jgi:quercetin dioxygenase-like cupin family protein
MFHINERDCAYRFGDSGPKYFLRGPRAGMGQARLKPGEDFGNHCHEVMEENFFVLKGKVEFVVNGKSYIGEKGDLYSMKPKESHYLKNVGDDEAIILFCLAPFIDGDKVNLPFEKID